MNIAQTIRFADWWLFKMPPLLSVAYVVLLYSGSEAGPALLLLGSSLWSIACVAAYGYVINDLFDIEQDRRSGKPNRMATLSPVRRCAVCIFTLAVAGVPFCWIDYGTVGYSILLCNYLLPTVYSVPGIRLKERGVLGPLCDAAGAHTVPTLFIAWTFSPDLRVAPPDLIVLLTLFVAWNTLLGVKGILNHQVADRDRDEKAWARTFLTDVQPERILRFLTGCNLFVEIPLVLLLMGFLFPTSPWAALAFIVYSAIEITKHLIGWQFVYREGVGKTARLNLPLANTFFDQVWLPTVLAVQLGVRGLHWCWIPLAHLLLFSPNLLRLLRDLAPLPLMGMKFYDKVSGGPQLALAPNCVARRRRWFGKCRVEIAHPGQEPWEIALYFERQNIYKRQYYRVRFWARSDRARLVLHGISEGKTPWRNLGLNQALKLGPAWREFITDFVADADEPDACVFFWLGGNDIAVDLANVRVEPTSATQVWLLKQHLGCQAQLLASIGGPRIEVGQPGQQPWEITIHHGGYEVRARQSYRLGFRARADRPRAITHGICQANPPWQGLGLFAELLVGPEWREFVTDFVASADETDACQFFWLGGNDASIEITNAQFALLPAAEVKLLNRHDGCQAQLLALPEAWRVEVSRPGQQVWDIAFYCGSREIKNGERYCVGFRARADRPRSMVYGVGQANPPWQSLGCYEEVLVGPEWRDFVADFVASADELQACQFFWLGGCDIAVELADLCWEISSVRQPQTSSEPGNDLISRTIEQTMSTHESKLRRAGDE